MNQKKHLNVKKRSFVKFNETLEVAVNLGIDSNKTDQNIKINELLNGTGKQLV